ncbi:hypothetical protein NG99_26235 [Erwinia typographi]|uniref:Uncharacterized protein n=1 Tax=Erwinia typographi TaxID=371042 RepID=A0A0A3ZKH8_9GAMM|nr:hypothetical protein [Erwinia typographi]KGT86263.1 hypothetical protein NG99_26235 [Erwinia typographi]
MGFESSSTVVDFCNTFQVPDNLYWDNGRFEPKDGFDVSEETADMFTNLLAGFIAGYEASGRMTDFDVTPFCRNP